MATNTGDNYDPVYPEGIDFVEIGVEEKEGTVSLSEKDEEMIAFEYKWAKVD